MVSILPAISSAGIRMNLARALGHEVSSAMSNSTPIVFVVNDDVSVRKSLVVPQDPDRTQVGSD